MSKMDQARKSSMGRISENSPNIKDQRLWKKKTWHTKMAKKLANFSQFSYINEK